MTKIMLDSINERSDKLESLESEVEVNIKFINEDVKEAVERIDGINGGVKDLVKGKRPS